MYTTIFERMKLVFRVFWFPMNLIGDRFDVLSHVVDEFPARFLIEDDIGKPAGDEFVAMVIVVLIENAAVDFGVVVDIIDQGLDVGELW